MTTTANVYQNYIGPLFGRFPRPLPTAAIAPVALLEPHEPFCFF